MPQPEPAEVAVGQAQHALGGVVGQNDFGWWVDEEDMAFNVCMHVESRKRTDDELKKIQFRVMANRGYFMYGDQMDLCHRIPDWYAELNHIYNQVVGDMQERSLLTENQGVRWQNGDITIFWVFEEMKLDLDPGAAVEVIRKSGPEALDAAATLIAKPGTVYRLTRK